MNFSTISSLNLEIHWEHSTNATQTTNNSHSPRNKHSAENLQWSHINMRMTITWGINEVMKLLSMLPSIAMTKMKERGKAEETLYMYCGTAENLKECPLFFAWKAKMQGLVTAGHLLQVLWSFEILSKFDYFNDKESSEPLSFNEVWQ